MNRRKALSGILGLTGIGLSIFAGFKYFSTISSSNKGQLLNYLNLISELVDVIIPPTETPGAKQAKVQDYIINFLEVCASNKEYNNFFNGLNNLQETCLNNYNKNFEACSISQKNELLANFEDTSNSNNVFNKIDNKIRGRSFYNLLRTLTIEGYCTSEIGAKEHLSYAPLPVKYIAVTTLKTNQKAWATR